MSKPKMPVIELFYEGMRSIEIGQNSVNDYGAEHHSIGWTQRSL